MEITKLEMLFCKRLHREVDGIQSLAEKIGVNKSLLYDVESGRRAMSVFLFDKITKYYGITYDHDESLYNEAYDTLIKLFKLYISYQPDELYKLYDNYKAKQTIYENSKAFVFVDLFNAIYYLKRYEYDEVNHCLNNCQDYLEIYDNNIIYLYAMIWIFIRNMNKDLNEIKSFIYPMCTRYSLLNLDKHILGVTYYQIGRIKEASNDIFESLEYYEKSLQCFYKLNIHQRVIQVEIQKANCYFYLKQYKLAEKTYLKLYNESINHGYITRAKYCCGNLAFIYFIQEDYKNTMKYVELSREHGGNFPDLNYYEAYIFYKTKAKQIARHKIKKLIEIETDVRVKHTLKLMHSMLNENEKNIQKYFAYCEADNEAINANLDLQILYKMLIDYYEQHNSDRATDIMRKYIKKF